METYFMAGFSQFNCSKGDWYFSRVFEIDSSQFDTAAKVYTQVLSELEEDEHNQSSAGRGNIIITAFNKV